tara:strand:+ start:72 stop:629 length:558 start_codon:yes stop_codon:yes gene_type:complete
MEIVTYCNCNIEDKLNYIKARRGFHDRAQRILKNRKSKANLPPIDMSKIIDKVRAGFTEYNPAPPEEGEEDLLEAAERQEREDKEVEKDYAWPPHTTDLHILDGSIHSFTYKDGEQSVSLNLYIDDDDDQCNGMQDMLEVFTWLMEREESSKSITLERDEDGLIRLTINVVRKWRMGPSKSDEEE